MKKLNARRVMLQATPVAAAVAALCWMPGAASAQTAPAAAPAGDVVTITGIRRGIESAIAVKKSADTIVEAISSEDLGKLPDPSVADAISRLPGVAAQRNKGSGKAQAISVRGMSPDFNGALLNGREVASSGDSRGVDFDLYPAELTNSALVYKTPHAGLMGTGIASTIDLRTVRPLDSGSRQVALNYRDQKTGIDNGVPNGEGKGDRMSAAYVDQFFNRTIGVAFGYTKFTEEGAGQLRANTWGGWTPTLDYQGQQIGVPGGFGRDIEFSDQSREAMMGVLQWKPNKNFETTIDFFRSEGRSANFKKGIEGFIGGLDGARTGDPNAGWLRQYRNPPSIVSASNIVTNANGDRFAGSGTVDSFKGVIRNHNEGADDELNAWGLNLRYKLDGWTFIGDAANSKVTKRSARYETTAGLPGNGNASQRDGAPVTPGATGTISWTGFTGTNHGDLKFTSPTNFADRNTVKLTDVMGWGGGPNSPQAGYVASPFVKDEVMNLRLGARRDLTWGPVIGVDAGINFVERSKTATTQEGFLVIAGTSDPFAGLTIPGSSTLTVDGINIATWDPRGSLGSVYSLRPNTYGAVINRNWTVKEEVTTGFVKADLDGELFGKQYSGNLGVQLVNTKQTSTGFVNDSGRCTGATADTCVSLAGGKTYTDLLPSLNLSMEVMPELVARLGIARTMSRPTMRDMRASIDQPSLPTPPLTPVQRIVSSGGNPELEPFRATAYDISLEKYFGNKGYVSVAGFYKDISTYILTLPTVYDFAGVIPANFALPSGGTVGFLNRPTNGKGGSISGIELAVNIPLSMLWKPLDGFGIAINHSDTKSSITILPGQVGGLIPGPLSFPLPGLSRKVTNTRMYYEKHGFQVAVSSRKRSDFLGQIPDYKDDVEITFIRGETVVDAQIGYTFSDKSFLRGLSVLFQANNIGDELFRQYQTDRDSPTDTKRYGKTYLLGVNYKF